MPLNSAGNFGGPQYGWGSAPGGQAQSGNSGPNRGRYTSSPEAGLHRGEWQWRGHGPSAQQSYGWDYQGGVGRDEITQRSEARMGSSFQARMAQERSGGLPRARYAVDYDRSADRGGRGNDVQYDWGWQGRGGGGMNPGADRYGGDFRASGGGWTGSGSRQVGQYGATDQRYGNDFRNGGYGASGGFLGGSGNRQMGGYGATSQRYENDFRGGSGASGGWTGSGSGYGRRSQAEGMRSRGGYGRDFQAGYDRGFGGGYGAQGGGMRGQTGGRYGGDYGQPLSDTEFYRRVERW